MRSNGGNVPIKVPIIQVSIHIEVVVWGGLGVWVPAQFPLAAGNARVLVLRVFLSSPLLALVAQGTRNAENDPEANEKGAQKHVQVVICWGHFVFWEEEIWVLL